MTTYAFVHGAGDVGWYWHLVERELRVGGHRTAAPDLPIDDELATLRDHAQVVVDAVRGIHDGGEVGVVGQSWGGYVAPIAAEALRADRLILVAAMIPRPGESAEEMFSNTGWEMPGGASGTIEVFYHDVDPRLAAEAVSRARPQSDATGREPWPLAAWPPIPTRAIVCRDDRFFGAEWLSGVVRDRLGIEADRLDSGHTPALSHPRELVELMESYRTTG